MRTKFLQEIIDETPLCVEHKMRKFAKEIISKKMKREILFKGICIKTDKWVFGNLVRYLGLQKEFTTAIQVLNENQEVVSVRNIYPETVCQYTGLTDKNGVKIFEGDFDQNYDVVKWCKNSLGYGLFTYDHSTNEFINCNCFYCSGNYSLSELLNDIEIIGNIHTT